MNAIVSVLVYLVVVVVLWWALQRAIQTMEPVAVHGGHAEHAAPMPDDLTRIEGIGPKISEILGHEGITTFAALAATDEARLDVILEAAGSRFQLADPETWPEQAGLAAAGKWDELNALQERLMGGRE